MCVILSTTPQTTLRHLAATTHRQTPCTRSPQKNLAVSLDTFLFGRPACQVLSSHWAREEDAHSAASLGGCLTGCEWAGEGRGSFDQCQLQQPAPPTHHNPSALASTIWAAGTIVPEGWWASGGFMSVLKWLSPGTMPNCEKAFMTCATLDPLPPAHVLQVLQAKQPQGPKQVRNPPREDVPLWCTSGSTADNNDSKSNSNNDLGPVAPS